MVVDNGVLVKSQKAMDGFLKNFKNNKVIKGITAASTFVNSLVDFARKSEPIDRIISGITSILGTPALTAVEYIVAQLQSQTSAAMADSITNIFIELNKPMSKIAITALATVISDIIRFGGKITEIVGVMTNLNLQTKMFYQILADIYLWIKDIPENWKTAATGFLQGFYDMFTGYNFFELIKGIIAKFTTDMENVSFIEIGSKVALKLANGLVDGFTTTSFTDIARQFINSTVLSFADVQFTDIARQFIVRTVAAFLNVSFTDVGKEFVKQSVVAFASADYAKVAGAVLYGIANEINPFGKKAEFQGTQLETTEKMKIGKSD
jgi:hypothetical protein